MKMEVLGILIIAQICNNSGCTCFAFDFCRYLADDFEQLGNNYIIIGRSIGKRSDVLLGCHDDVSLPMRTSVMKSNYIVCLVLDGQRIEIWQCDVAVKIRASVFHIR